MTNSTEFQLDMRISNLRFWDEPIRSKQECRCATGKCCARARWTIFAKRSIGPSMAAGTSYSEYGLSLPGYLFGRRYLSIWKVAETARQLSRNWIALTAKIRPWS